MRNSFTLFLFYFISFPKIVGFLLFFLIMEMEMKIQIFLHSHSQILEISFLWNWNTLWCWQKFMYSNHDNLKRKKNPWSKSLIMFLKILVFNLMSDNQWTDLRSLTSRILFSILLPSTPLITWQKKWSWFFETNVTIQGIICITMHMTHYAIICYG